VTICRVTGDAENPLAPTTVRRDNLGAYLTRAGTVTVVPTSGCQASTAPDGGENPPIERATWHA
jgi:hypothetical protein